MNLDLPNIDAIIRVNNLKPVTNPILFNSTGEPTYDGLLSYEIFGSTAKQRESRFAYINLYGKYLTPEAYKAFKRLNRNIDLIVSGAETFKIDENGKLVKDPNGNTGIKWLYKEWNKIKWEKSNSSTRNERIDLLTLNNRDILFVDKFIVFPALYRDVNNQAGSKEVGSVNSLYTKLMRYAAMSVDTSNFDIMITSYEYGIQQTLVEIYDYFKNKIEKKNGALRKQLLGKSTDYSSRLVITAPRHNYNSFSEDMPINIDTAGVPMYAMCSIFFPFMINWLRNYFINEIDAYKNKWRTNIGKTKEEYVYVKLLDPISYFNDDFLKKRLKHFMKSYYDRYDTVKLPVKNPEECRGKEFVTVETIGYDKTGKVLFKRDLTWADLIYRAAYNISKDKHVVITRYPCLDYFGSFVSRVHVLSTIETIECTIDGVEYKYYPNIDLSCDANTVSTMFQDTLNMSNIMLKGLGGDYDGDQVTIKSLYTQEANEEAEKILKSASYIINGYGENMRTSTKECIEAMYQLTRR